MASVDGSSFERIDRATWVARWAGASADGTEPVALVDGLPDGELDDVLIPLGEMMRARIERAVARTGVGVIGVAGPVAVGKTTFARALAAVLSSWTDGPRVETVSTDSFLMSNSDLERRGLTMDKGFPQTYNLDALGRFVNALRSGESPVRIPRYSHITYDIVADAEQVIDEPDVVILEGVVALRDLSSSAVAVAAGDFAVYLDADEVDLRRWYCERFEHLRSSARDDDGSFFRRFAALTPDQAEEVALGVWERINSPNLHEHIEPTRERADVVVHKGADHRVDWVALRRD